MEGGGVAAKVRKSCEVDRLVLQLEKSRGILVEANMRMPCRWWWRGDAEREGHASRAFEGLS